MRSYSICHLIDTTVNGHLGLWFWPLSVKGKHISLIKDSSRNRKFLNVVTISYGFLCRQSHNTVSFLIITLPSFTYLSAWMDGTRSSSGWAIKWEVWCLQLRCHLVGACHNATAMEQFKSSTGGKSLFYFTIATMYVLTRLKLQNSWFELFLIWFTQWFNIYILDWTIEFSLELPWFFFFFFWYGNAFSKMKKNGRKEKRERRRGENKMGEMVAWGENKLKFSFLPCFCSHILWFCLVAFQYMLLGMGPMIQPLVGRTPSGGPLTRSL